MAQMRISEAAELLGVSDDTIRRWIESGRLQRGSSTTGPATVDASSVAAVMVEQSTPTDPQSRRSARNRFPGIVTRVERDGVMALVEIQAGPHRITSLISREAADDLGLEPGVLVSGVVKATNVTIELDQ